MKNELSRGQTSYSRRTPHQRRQFDRQYGTASRQPPSRSALRRVSGYCVFVFGLLVVAGLLLTPAQAMPETGLWDKLEHTVTFTALTLLGLFAFPERRSRWPVAIGIIVFGAICEGLQTFVPGRNTAIADAVANTLGTILAVIAWQLIGSVYRRHVSERQSGREEQPRPAGRG